jgi:K+-sensing histidine kinase KdpD
VHHVLRPHPCVELLSESAKIIAAHHLDQLFSAFFTTKPGGMGMGLSISCSIIEAHGSRPWASPDTPHSAILHFALPVERSRSPGDVAPGSRRRSS